MTSLDDKNMAVFRASSPNGQGAHSLKGRQVKDFARNEPVVLKITG
jgi:hypothetical protein